MKIMRYSTVAVAALLLAGCATTFRPWNLSQVQEGMPRDEVVRILGDPDSTEMKDGAEHLFYTYREDYNPIPTSSGMYDQDIDRAFRDINRENAFKEYQYVVILVDGRVINYKQLQ